MASSELIREKLISSSNKQSYRKEAYHMPTFLSSFSIVKRISTFRKLEHIVYSFPVLRAAAPAPLRCCAVPHAIGFPICGPEQKRESAAIHSHEIIRVAYSKPIR